MHQKIVKDDDAYDVKSISEAIIHWYAAHVNTLLYARKHPSITDTLKNACQCIQKSFRDSPKITLDMANGKVIFNGKELQDDHMILGNYASWMISRRIRSLIFSDGITRRELIDFHRIISEQELTEDALTNILSNHNITHLGIHLLKSPGDLHSEINLPEKKQQSMEYNDRFHVIHEEASPHQISFTSFVADLSMKTPSEEGTHQVPIEGFMGNTFDPGGETTERRASLEADLLLESTSKDGNQTIPFENYIDTIHVPADTGSDAGPAAPPLRFIGGEFSETDDQVRSVEMLSEQGITDDERRIIENMAPDHIAHILNAILPESPGEDVLRRIAAVCFLRNGTCSAEDYSARQRIFIEELTPKLRHHFLMLCLSLINSGSQAAALNPSDASYIGTAGLSGIPMAEGRISAVTSQAPETLIQTLGDSDFIFDFVVDDTAVLHDLEINAESASLFDGNQLSRLQESFNAKEAYSRLCPDEGRSSSVAMLIEVCSHDEIQAASFDILIEIIDSENIGSEVLQKMLAKLTSLSVEFLAQGKFDKILDLYNALRTKSLQEKNDMYVVIMIRSIFSTDSFNSEAVDALRKYGRQQRDTAGKFMLALHAYLVPFMLDALSEETDPSKRRFIITLLISVKGDVLPFIMNRLRDPRWYVVRNMLYLLRECHGRSYEKDTRDFLDHKDALVKLEALRTLLSFQDPEAEPYVRQFLKSKDLELQKGAVRLAGAYRIKNAVPQMIRLLKEKDRRGTKFLLRKSIVRMLGRIGDSRAVDPLLQLCRSSSVVRKDDLEKLKVEIFKTLRYYPVATIGPVLDYGMQSPDGEIVTICRKLIKRYKLPDPRGVA